MRYIVSSALLVATLCAGCGGGGGGDGGGGPAPASSNADLVALVPSVGTLTPAFDPAVIAYGDLVSAFTTDVTLTPTAADPGATIAVNGQPTSSGAASASVSLAVGLNPVTVMVTAANGTTQRAYVVFFSRPQEPTQEAYLKASNTDSFDVFGLAVGVSGDTLVVGAPGEASSATGVNGNEADDSAPTAGAVYVFVRTGNTWTQQAYLKASNTDSGDQFGRAVGISGDTVVVGAYLEDSGATGVDGDEADDSAPDAGAAYVFVRTGSTWTQQAYLKASNTDPFDHFGGAAIGVSGDTIVVAAWGEDSSATGVNGNGADNSAGGAGAAYVFVRTGGTWTHQAYLKASNTDVFDLFGTGVAVSGDTLVVSARNEASSATGVNGNEADDSAFGAGAAYVFVRTGGAWTQQAYLKASNTDPGDQFGSAVGVSGNTIVVGAYQEDSSSTGVNGYQADDSAIDAGAAYVFVRTGSTWTQQVYVKASNAEAGDSFGAEPAVAVSGDTIVVGAYQEESSATGVNGNEADNSVPFAGAAYVLR